MPNAKRAYKGKGYVPYLRCRRRRFYVQVPVPKHLQSRVGRKTLETYLGTADPREAKLRAPRAVADIRAWLDRRGEGGPMTADEIRNTGLTELHEIYADLRSDPVGGLYRLEGWLSCIECGDFETLDDGSTATGSPFGPGGLRWKAIRIIEQKGAEATEDSVSALCHALADAAYAAKAMFERNITPPPLAPRPRRKDTSGATPTVSRLGELYLNEWKSRLTEQTMSQARATFRLFADYTGDVRLDEVTRLDVTGFLDALASLHPHYGRRPGSASLSLAELLERFAAPDGEGLSNRTLNRHLSALSGLARWARQRGYIPEDFASPFREQRRAVDNKPWLPFTTEELNSLFRGLTFETRPAKHTYASALPWIMAVALFSGMREGEICELDAADVRKEAGVRFFDITAAKSEAGIRRVPVHSRLVELGFLKYVGAIGAGPLFPRVTPGGPDQKRAHSFAKRFPAYRRDVANVARDRLAFHSF